jgi:hypothetical protein
MSACMGIPFSEMHCDLLLELPGPQALPCTYHPVIYICFRQAYVIGALDTSFTRITGSHKVRYTMALPLM